MGLEAMTKTEMIEILRGKKLLKAPENNDELLSGFHTRESSFFRRTAGDGVSYNGR